MTGWRKGEIASLAWRDVERESKALRLSWRASKNRRPRRIALEGELWAIIERRWRSRVLPATPGGANRVAEFVFHRNGEPVGDFAKAWRSACQAAGALGRLFHDLRRTAIRNMVRACVDPAVAMKISGHRTADVFRRYDITSDEDIRQAVLKTQAFVEQLPTERTVLPLRVEDGGR